MHARLLTLPLAVLLAAGASAENPLFISGNVMTGLTWHAAKSAGTGSSGSCALTPNIVQYFSAPFFTDTTADSYSLHLYYESFQSGFVYLYQDAFDPADPCTGLFEFGFAPIANIYDIHLEAGRQYFFVTSEDVLFGGGGSFQVTIEGPAGSQMSQGTITGCGVASATPYGAGTAGTLGVPLLSSFARPALGEVAGVAISGGLPGAGPVALAAGFQPAALPFEGGKLLVIPSATFFQPALGPAGSASFTLQVPEDPALCGSDVFIQGAFVDPGAGGPHHIALTNGLHWMIGS